MEERRKLAEGPQKIAASYQDLLMSVGEETETLRDILVVDFLTWLANELAIVGNHMAVGKDYSSMESLRAFAQALKDKGCDHFDKVEVQERRLLGSFGGSQCHRHQLFDAFWRPGGHDLVLLRATLSCGQVCFPNVSFSVDYFHISYDMTQVLLFQTIEEQEAIKEEVKAYIVARDSRKHTGGVSDSGNATPAPSEDAPGSADAGENRVEP